MQYKIIPPPVLGINRQDNPAFLGTCYCYDLYNMQIKNTYIQKRFGYSVLGSGIDSTLTGLDICEFVDGAGLKHLLAFTNKTIYEYNNSFLTWEVKNLITSDGPPIVYHDLETLATRITMDVCLDIDNPPDWTSGIGLIISDGLKHVWHYDGTGNFLALDVSDITSFDYVKELRFDNGHLCFYAFKDTIYRLKNIRWTTGYDCDGTGAWTTGTTSEAVLPMVKGVLKRVIPLNKSKIIYSDRSITLQSYVGGDDIYTFDSITNDIGLIGEKSVIEFIMSNLFMSDNLNIYELNSSNQLTVLSSLINAFILEDFNLTYKNKIFLWNDKNNKRIYIFYVGKNDGSSVKSYIAINMLYNNISWERGNLADGITAFADYISDKDYKCNDVLFSGVTCQDTPYSTWRCDDARILGGGTSPVMLAEAAKALVIDEKSVLDISTPITCVYETGDVTIQEASELTFFRASKVSVNATKKRTPDADSNLTIEYSIDGGETYVECVDSPIELSNQWETYTLDVTDEQTRQIRFKLSNDDFGDVQISELTLHYNPISVMD